MLTTIIIQATTHKRATRTRMNLHPMVLRQYWEVLIQGPTLVYEDLHLVPLFNRMGIVNVCFDLFFFCCVKKRGMQHNHTKRSQNKNIDNNHTSTHTVGFKKMLLDAIEEALSEG